MSRYLQPHLKCGCHALCCAWKAVAAKIDVKQRWLNGDRGSRSIRSRAAEYRPLVTRPELEFRRPDSVNGRYRLRNWIGSRALQAATKAGTKNILPESSGAGRPSHNRILKKIEATSCKTATRLSRTLRSRLIPIPKMRTAAPRKNAA